MKKHITEPCTPGMIHYAGVVADTLCGIHYHEHYLTHQVGKATDEEVTCRDCLHIAKDRP